MQKTASKPFASPPSRIPPMQPPRRGRQPPAPCVRQHVRLRLRGRDVSDPGRGGDGRGGHEGLHRARPEEDGGGDTGGARGFDADTGVLPSPQITMLGFSFRIQRLLLPPAAKGLRGNRVRAEAKDHVRIMDGNTAQQQDITSDGNEPMFSELEPNSILETSSSSFYRAEPLLYKNLP